MTETIRSLASLPAPKSISTPQACAILCRSIRDMASVIKRTSYTPDQMEVITDTLDGLHAYLVDVMNGSPIAPGTPTVYPTEPQNADTYAVGYTPEGKNLAGDEIPADFGNADATPALEKKEDAPAKPANDISALDNSILTELASRKRMTGGDIVSFVVGAGLNKGAGKDALARLEGAGRIIATGRKGRGTIYGLPVKEVTPVTPAPIPPAVVAAVLMNLPGDLALCDAHVDAYNADNAKRQPAKRKPARKPQKPKSAPPATTPTAPQEDSIPEGFGNDDATTVKVESAPVQTPAPEAIDKTAPNLTDATTNDLLREIQKRLDATTMSADAHLRGDTLITSLRAILAGR